MLQGTLTQIVKRYWAAILKFNFNTFRVRQLDAEIIESTTPDRRSTSYIGRCIIDKNFRFHWITKLIIKEADSAARNIFDLEQSRDNVIRMISSPREETNAGNSTDCFFTIFTSVTAVEPELICTIQSLLQPITSTINVRTKAITTHFPILWATNAILDLSNLVPGYATSESFFANKEITVNTNYRTQTTNEYKRKILRIRCNKLFEYHCNPTPSKLTNIKDRVKKSISPAHNRTDESEEDDFLDEIIPGITIPHLLLHKSDIETEQRTQQKQRILLRMRPRCDQIHALEMNIQKEENKDNDQLTNKLERIISDGTEDNGDEDQSEHTIESMHFTKGNDGL
ncbi:MAG: hypothetical protein EZS28_037039 [Streblomastix strix]|uniref:Uncharacterized protein n=1 Tax=Streblomastix strix TaxID=222440 RepID=A0A5J4UB93_9EUKA|nr:MAG: hypothetical protein EZS28_037039 [Streblomastix strix]